MVVVASWSASNVPVHRKPLEPTLKRIRATEFICVPHVPAWQVASTSQAAAALGIWKSKREEVTMCVTWGAEMRSCEGLVPAGSSISITSVCALDDRRPVRARIPAMLAGVQVALDGVDDLLARDLEDLRVVRAVETQRGAGKHAVHHYPDAKRRSAGGAHAERAQGAAAELVVPFERGNRDVVVGEAGDDAAEADLLRNADLGGRADFDAFAGPGRRKQHRFHALRPGPLGLGQGGRFSERLHLGLDADHRRIPRCGESAGGDAQRKRETGQGPEAEHQKNLPL